MVYKMTLGSFDFVCTFAYFTSILFLSHASCIPDKTSFYWKTPCDNQKFSNVITLTNLTATQNGVNVDTQGGLDLSVPLKSVSSIIDGYGVINKPLIDFGMFEYTKHIIGQCQWMELPTFGLLDNKNSCDIVDNCHLTNHPTVLTVTVNFKDMAGVLIAAVTPGNYYGFTMTFKDDNKPLLCVYAQSKVIKK